MRTYKEGDSVRVRSKLWYWFQKKDAFGSILKSPGFNRFMVDLCGGKKAMVTKVTDKGEFSLTFPLKKGKSVTYAYRWCSWMVRPVLKNPLKSFYHWLWADEVKPEPEGAILGKLFIIPGRYAIVGVAFWALILAIALLLTKEA